MNDIKFAKLHAGETFYFRGEEVKIVGYDSVGCGASVIVEGFSVGWSADALSPGDVILIPPVDDKTVKHWYVGEYDLDRAADEEPTRILIIGELGPETSRMAKLIKSKYRLPIVDQTVTGLDHISTAKGIYVSNCINPVEAAKRKDEFKLIILM
ncbi:hypothetical protein [Bacteroides cellulosilyticus]|uniref:hypothetical protein n=1 Tax=Bacteroides cellulosilyticus TaxID=246787 RepID=UPI0032EBDF07